MPNHQVYSLAFVEASWNERLSIRRHQTSTHKVRSQILEQFVM